MTDSDERLDVLAELAELGELEAEPELDPTRDEITLVLVAHDGPSARSHHGIAVFDEVLSGIAAQTRQPERIVIVDTSTEQASITATAKLVAKVLPHAVVVHQPGGFAGAVEHGLHALDGAQPLTLGPGGRNAEGRIEWVWLLHDDSAPEPDALEQLLLHTQLSPSTTVVGPKCVDFDDPRIIVEVGITTDRAGRRETGLEHHELDQGQHDGPHDVLAVGSAGLLSRRDVWDKLRGFDPELDFARDDLDFGWRAWLAGERVAVVPAACIRHARSIWRGLRVLDETHSHRRDRRNAAYVVLVNASTLGFLFGIPRLLMGVLARSLGHLLTRSPLTARSDVAALPLLMRPGPLFHGRRRRKGQVTMPHSTVNDLLASRTLRLRGYVQAVMDWASGGDNDAPTLEMGGGLGIDDEVDGIAVLGSTDETTILRRLLRRPAIFLALIITTVSLVAGRELLGRGPLAGGRLLPVPSGSDDLWSRLLTDWHDVGAGTSAVASIWTGPLAFISTITLGKPWIPIYALLLGLPLLAATSIWRATRDQEIDVRVRAWAAAAYAMSPATIAVILSGRFDVAWVLIAAPTLVRGISGIVGGSERYSALHTTWAYALWLTLAAAFWPPAWTITAVAMLATAIATRARGHSFERARIVRVAILLITPVALALSAAPQVLRHLEVAFAGWGVAGGVAGIKASDAPGALDVLFMHSSQSVGPLWLAAPLILGAIAAYLRPGTRGTGSVCLATAVGLLAAGLLVSRVALGGVGAPVGAPDGYFALASLALIVACTFAARGLNTALAGRSFSWRQPAIVVLAVVVAAVPAVSAISWAIEGETGALHRNKTAKLPAFVTAETNKTPGTRALFLDRDDDHSPVSWSLSALTGPMLGDEDVDDPLRNRLASVVSDLTSRRGTDAGELLSTFGISYIAIPVGADDSLVNALDEAPALSRVAFVGPLRLWKPTFVSGRVLVLPPLAAKQALEAPDSSTWSQRLNGRGPTPLPRAVGSPQVLPIGTGGGKAQIPVGIANRLVVVAVPFHSGWTATYAGKKLTEQKAWGWASGFQVPTTAGELKVSRTSSSNAGMAAVTAVAALFVLVLAAPDLRRRREDEDDE